MSVSSYSYVSKTSSGSEGEEEGAYSRRGDIKTPAASAHKSREKTRKGRKNTRAKRGNKLPSTSGSESRSRSTQRKTRSRTKTKAPKKEVNTDSLEEKEDEDGREEAGYAGDSDDVQFVEHRTLPVESASLSQRSKRPPLSVEQIEETRRIMGEVGEVVDELEVRDVCPSLKSIRQSGGQGRPAETGDYYLKQLHRGKKELLDAAREYKMVVGETAVPAKLSDNRILEEKRAMKELEFAPLRDLPSRIMDAVNGIDLVLEKSGNLKGEHRGRLKRSAAMTKAAITLLIQRSEGLEKGMERDVELERLRERIASQEQQIVELHNYKATHDKMKEEMQNFQRQLEEAQAKIRSLEEGKEGSTRPTRTVTMASGAKKRKPSSSPEMSVSEQEDDPAVMDMDRSPLEEEEEEARRKAEENRLRIMEEIERQGMPAAVRPPIKGKVKIIEPAMPAGIKAGSMNKQKLTDSSNAGRMPASGSSTSNTGLKEDSDSLEERLAKMLVKKVDRMGEQLLAKMVDMFPQMSIQGKEERKSRVPSPTPFPNKVPANEGKAGKAGKNKGKKGKGREGVKDKGVTPVPTSTVSATQVQTRTQVLRKREDPSPTSVTPATKPQEQRQVPGRVNNAPGTSATSEWTEVVKRRPKATGKGTKASQTQGPTNVPKGGTGKGGSGVRSSSSSPKQEKEKKKKRKVPRTSAVTLTCPPETYAECMSVVRRKIALAELGIEKAPHVRRTATGALSLELSGQNNAAQADRLATKMAEVLSNKEGVRVGRPMLTADLRLWGFEESVTAEEVKEVLAAKGNTPPENIRVGPIRKGSNGLCSVLVSCPLAAANTITRETRVTLGWSSTRVEMLDKRPLQCYKCLEHGHTRATCRSNADRTGACYRCGETGHTAGDCTAPVRCIVCAEKGKPSGHRVGGPSCTGCKKGKGGKGKGKQTVDEKPAETAQPQPQKNPQKKTKKGLVMTSMLEVTGYQVTCSGRVIAGVPKGADAEPPKEQRKKREKKTDLPSSGKDAEKMDVEETQSVNEEHTGVPPTKREEEGTPMQVDNEESLDVTEAEREGREESGDKQR